MSLKEPLSVYYLANGSFATSIDELAVELPGSGPEKNKFEWGYCNLDSGEIKCNLSEPALRYNVQGLESESYVRQCRVYPGKTKEELRKAVCASLTRDTAHNKTTSGGGTYISYTFK